MMIDVSEDGFKSTSRYSTVQKPNISESTGIADSCDAENQRFSSTRKSSIFVRNPLDLLAVSNSYEFVSIREPSVRPMSDFRLTKSTFGGSLTSTESPIASELCGYKTDVSRRKE